MYRWSYPSSSSHPCSVIRVVQRESMNRGWHNKTKVQPAKSLLIISSSQPPAVTPGEDMRFNLCRTCASYLSFRSMEKTIVSYTQFRLLLFAGSYVEGHTVREVGGLKERRSFIHFVLITERLANKKRE